MFTHTNSFFGRVSLRNISIIAIVALLAGYFTFFDQVKPTSAQSTLDQNEITFSDSRPSQTSNFQVTFSTPDDIDNSLCPAQPCGAVVVILPVDAQGDALFTITTSTTNEISVADGASTWTPFSVSTTNSNANNNVADTIIMKFNAPTSTLFYSKANSYTVTYGGLNVTNPSVTGTSMGITVGADVNNGNGFGVDFGVYSSQGSSNVIFNDATTLSATVNTAVSFTVTGVNASTLVGNEFTDVATTPTTCAFGTLVPNVPKICAHQIDIATNSPNGYYVYVVQTANMANGSGDDINQFQNGTRTDDTAATTWTAPQGIQATSSTHGHLGYSSDDTDVFGFGNDYYAGIPNLDDNDVTTTGLALSAAAATQGDTQYINYQIEVSPVQPAGTYTNTVIYLVTARY